MRDLKADLELCQKATPGPWEYDGMHNEIHTPQGEEYFLIISECRAAPDQEFICDSFGHHYDNNFAFIAAAREGWPEAIERAIKAEEEVVKLQAERDICGKWPVRIGEYFCGAEIVGADYKRKTVTIEWRGQEVTP